MSKVKSNRKTAMLLAGVVVGMFGFAFAMVPLYNLICQVTGLKSFGVASEIAKPVDLKRKVMIEFDGIVNANLPWEFEPETRKIEVNPGKAVTVAYTVRNFADEAVTGQAIPSVIPWFGNKYLSKMECFCFNNQTLEAGEIKKMPVRLLINSEIPEDIKVLRLSYTFMNVDKNYVLNQEK